MTSSEKALNVFNLQIRESLCNITGVQENTHYTPVPIYTEAIRLDLYGVRKHTVTHNLS